MWLRNANPTLAIMLNQKTGCCMQSLLLQGYAKALETAQLGLQLALLLDPVPIKGKRQGEQ